MPEWLPEWFTSIDRETLGSAVRVVLLVVVGWPAVRLLAALAGRVFRDRLTAQGNLILRKVIRYGGVVILLAMILPELGFKLTALLGAAGIAGVAIGFASQTSLSNVISGIFLIWERPFEIGDLIVVSGKTGIVESIDLLSVKIRTHDNKFIRIPNETMIKTEVTNNTHFPILRMDILLSVAYKEDVGRVVEVLRELGQKNPYVLDEPEPLILFLNFGESGLEFLYAPWFNKPDYVSLKNSIMREIKERFDQEGIEIPFPHMTLYAGKVSDPFPVQVIEGEPEAATA
jgi:small-conductance mechanosensitive channel